MSRPNNGPPAGLLRARTGWEPGSGNAPGSGGGGGNGGGRGGAMQQLLGDRMPRYSRLLDKLNQGSIIYKVPVAFGADEHNVIFGLGTSAPVAAGGTTTFTQNAPRDLILRKLQIYDVTSIVNGFFAVTAITVEGNALMLGGASGGACFIPGSFYGPEFDIPVAGGTPVQVTVQNLSLVPGVVYVATFFID